MLRNADSPEILLPALPVETIAGGGNDDAIDLLLLHGWGLHSEFFRPWAPLLAPHCRIHLIDLPGHGHSPAVAPYTLDAMAAAVANAMRPVAATYAIAGWSLGGAVALRMAIDYPGAVSHVVTLASSPRFMRADDWQHATTPHALELLRAGLARDYTGTLAQFFELNMAGRYREHADALAALAVLRPPVRPDVLAPGIALTSGVDLRAEVAAIRAPLLAISGRLDRLSYSQSSAWLAQATGGRHVELPHAAHVPHLSHGSEVAEHVLAHLAARHAAAGAAT